MCLSLLPKIFALGLILCLVQSTSAFLAPPNTTDVRNVKTQFGAKGDGVHDDTAAIQSAISTAWTWQGGLVYLPAGTYLISNTLIWKDTFGNWSTWIGLFGDSISTTKIVLKDSSSGFTDPNNPKAAIYTASGDFGGTPESQHIVDGSGNEAFKNYIMDLTLDTGNNQGVVGIDHIGNNNAALRNVIVTGSGTTGIALTRRFPGPMLFTNITVNGFQIGIDMATPEYSVAFEHIFLIGQSVAGLRNNANLVTARALISQNPTAPAIVSGTTGELSIVDSVFLGCPSNKVVAVANATAFFRNVSAPDCPSAIITGQPKGALTLPISEYATNTFSMLYTSNKSLNLPVMETPSFDDPNFDDWANVEDYGANGAYIEWDDDTAGVQRALNSGKSVIYFPKGWYLISRTLNVSGNVRKIIGYYAAIAPTGSLFGNVDSPMAFFHIFNNSHPNIFFEFVYVGSLVSTTSTAGMIGILHDSPADLVIQHCGMDSGLYSYTSTSLAGNLYMEDFVAAQVRIAKPGQKVWARHFNAELDGIRLWNFGAEVWILGFKIERPNTLIEMYNGSKTEVLGAYIYPVLATRPAEPAFLTVDSQFSLTSSYQAVYDTADRYAILVEETLNGKTAYFNHTNAVQYGYGDIIPLYSSVLPGPTTTASSSSSSSTHSTTTSGSSTSIHATSGQSTSSGQGTTSQSTSGQSTSSQSTSSQSTSSQSTSSKSTSAAPSSSPTTSPSKDESACSSLRYSLVAVCGLLFILL